MSEANRRVAMQFLSPARFGNELIANLGGTSATIRPSDPIAWAQKSVSMAPYAYPNQDPQNLFGFGIGDIAKIGGAVAGGVKGIGSIANPVTAGAGAIDSLIKLYKEIQIGSAFALLAIAIIAIGFYVAVVRG